jgi:hypothetical protein
MAGRGRRLLPPDLRALFYVFVPTCGAPLTIYGVLAGGAVRTAYNIVALSGIMVVIHVLLDSSGVI